jgi:hypothetical protein
MLMMKQTSTRRVRHACLGIHRIEAAHMFGYMDRDDAGELVGQSAINEPVGVIHIQMVLPLHVQLPSGEFRCLS